MRIARLLTNAAIGASLAFGSTAASASGAASQSICAGGQAGCVLPLGAPAAPPVSGPTGGEIVGTEAASTGAGWIFPALLGLAAIVAAVVLLSDDDDGNSP